MVAPTIHFLQAQRLHLFCFTAFPCSLVLNVTLLLFVVGLKCEVPSVFSVSLFLRFRVCASIIECGISFEIPRMFFVFSISLQHDAHACLSGGRVLEQRPVAILVRADRTQQFYS